MCWHLGASPGELNIVAPLKSDDEMMSRETENQQKPFTPSALQLTYVLTVTISPIPMYVNT